MRRERWLKPIVDLLRQGITPEKIALTIALGTLIGVIPALGTTTILCSVAALTLRLNIPAIQLVNGVVYPLQLILLIPFYRLGAWMFGADASTISLSGVTALFRVGMFRAMQSLWVVTMHALVAWLVTGAVVCTVVYAVALPVARYYGTRSTAQA
jgi:uncharacterized protein (DUF2062 family)